ncbi:cell wall-binding repeat-containing protein [Clostridium peptidivorans]|uniref:cell wall-binding repeat-containing protein n=1 Tax=Clostridium peptidivorans TaxID=100174 RepID=UPI0015CC27DA|nr:cell wall-binding repeat-containing protein [Clostridium peptidivorans]
MRKIMLNVVSALTLSLSVLLTFQVSAATLEDRLAGNNRYETGAEIVSKGWTTSDYAVIASGEGFADALCAAPLAKKYNAPILLTGKNTLDPNTKNQLERLEVKNVLVVGGAGVVSNNVLSEIGKMDIEVTRIAGQNRFETSLQVAKNIGDTRGVVVTNGFGFADALSIAPVAAQKGMPILLTDKVDLSDQVKGFLSNKSYEKSYIVGGSGVVSDKIASQLHSVTRLGGSSRYGTNAAVLNHFASEFSYDKVYVASGANYPDALSGSALAALSDSPLILVGTSIDPLVMASIRAEHDTYNNVIILGGTAVVSDAVANKIVSGKEDLKVSFIDVGQADSILIQTPNGKNMLIDAGNNDDGSKVVSYLKNMGITQLDIIAGTHPHEDHIGGLDTVINMFKVGKVYMPKVTSTTQTFQDVVTAINNKGMTITTPIPGESVDLDPDVNLEILAPNGDSYEDLNNYSIVFKLTYGSKSFLFTGDAEDVSEKEMLNRGYDLKADVLKVGHHGSNSSTTSEFLSAVSPKYAVISVGKGNTYGHPTQTTLDKLKNIGAAVYRTDELGTIVATCDGSNITFNTKPGSSNDGGVVPPVTTNKNIQIISVDLVKEIVTIKNNSTKNTDMTGWKLVSVEGNQTYNFPRGYILKAGATIRIASGNATGDLKWTGAYIWNNTGDQARLYDSNNALISIK